MAVPMVERLTKPTKSNRINVLEKRIKWLENYAHRSSNTNRAQSVVAI